MNEFANLHGLPGKFEEPVHERGIVESCAPMGSEDALVAAVAAAAHA